MNIHADKKPPEHSIILDNWVGEVHYLDAYHIHLIKPDDVSLDALADWILAGEPPRWERALLRLRDRLVGIFGLKTATTSTGQPTRPGTRQYGPGDKVGFFPVIARSATELVMAIDDKHLSFRVSLLASPIRDSNLYSAYLTTAVQFHNLGGRIYFLAIKPFHRLIVRQCLKRFLKQHPACRPGPAAVR